MQKPWAVLAGCAAVFLLGGHARAAASLSLKQAIQYALESSPAFDSAKKSQLISELQLKSAWAKLLPSLDASAVGGLQNNVAIASTTGSTSIYASNATAPWSSALSVGLTETLYDNGVSLTGLGVAKLGQQIAELNALKSRDSLALGVATEFYRFSLSTLLLEVRKQQQTLLDKQFKALESQYQQGFKPRSDFLRIKTQVQRAEIDRVTAENEIVKSEASLRKLLGVNRKNGDALGFEAVQVRREAPPVLPDKPPSYESFYDFKTARLQEDVNDKRVSLVRRNYYPQLSLTSGVVYSNQSFINSNSPFSAGQQLSWDVLLTVQSNLWDWGIRRREVEAAEYARDIQQNDINVGLLDLDSRVAALMADVTRVSRNFKLSQELLTLEEESNRTLTAQYREGKVAYLDLITSINSLLDARIQFYTSYFDALSSQAQYDYYDGKIYEQLVER